MNEETWLESVKMSGTATIMARAAIAAMLQKEITTKGEIIAWLETQKASTSDPVVKAAYDDAIDSITNITP